MILMAWLLAMNMAVPACGHADDETHCFMQVHARETISMEHPIAAMHSDWSVLPSTRIAAFVQSAVLRGQVPVGHRIMFTGSVILTVVVVAAWIMLLHQSSAKPGQFSSGILSSKASSTASPEMAT
ncbi:unnamed protein product [Symbiodinium natans]|uniref:Uncharacterized protein n=1 Tax=Symbiodinium natans TaxID=878477 RepID=A0A812IMG9_9DINO|nr:unnamed protein product [Symbiodinium natans]